MTKFLRVTMPDGSQWDVPASEIAAHRAASIYRNELDPHDPQYGITAGQVWQRLYEETITDPADLIDWAANNLLWSDVEASAFRVTGPMAVDYQAGWCNGGKEIVEHE